MPNVEKIMQLKAELFTNKEIAKKLSTEEEPLTYQAVSKIIKDNTPEDDGDGDGDGEGESNGKELNVPPAPKPTTKDKTVVAELVDEDGEGHIKTFTAEQYGDYSKANGRTRDGGKVGKLVPATKEMLRAYISSGWTPNMLKEKWQMNNFQLVTLVHELAKAELRDRAPTVNFKQDFFRF